MLVSLHDSLTKRPSSRRSLASYYIIHHVMETLNKILYRVFLYRSADYNPIRIFYAQRMLDNLTASSKV
jgi:hypothetical protein